MKKINWSFFLVFLGFQSCQAPKDKTTAQGDGSSSANFEKINPEFAEFAVLNTDFKSEDFEVVLLSQTWNYGSPNPIRLFNSVNGNVILEESRDDKDEEQGYLYYKLDKNANKMDSIYVPLSGKHRTGFIDNYMVRTNMKGDSEYTTWPLNGDKIFMKIAVINADLSWSAEKIKQQDQDIVSKSDYYFYDIDYINETDDKIWTLVKLFHCINGKWQVLHSRSDEKHVRLDEREMLNRYREDFFRSADDSFPNAVKNFTLKHYNKEQKLTYEHSIGGGSQSYEVKGWVGTGYFDIPLLQDTLKIKKSNLIIEEPTPAIRETSYYLSNGANQSVSPFHLNIYTNPALNFAIYSTSKYQVYAIRKKK